MYIIKVKGKWFISIRPTALVSPAVEIFETLEKAEKIAKLIGGTIYKMEIKEIEKENRK